MEIKEGARVTARVFGKVCGNLLVESAEGNKATVKMPFGSVTIPIHAIQNVESQN
jgi:hypothetical protein